MTVESEHQFLQLHQVSLVALHLDLTGHIGHPFHWRAPPPRRVAFPLQAFAHAQS